MTHCILKFLFQMARSDIDDIFVISAEIEEELAPLTESLEPPVLETYEDQITKCRAATNGLSWVQILG